MAREDLRVPDHRVTNAKWRDGWDRVFGNQKRFLDPQIEEVLKEKEGEKQYND